MKEMPCGHKRPKTDLKMGGSAQQNVKRGSKAGKPQILYHKAKCKIHM